MDSKRVANQEPYVASRTGSSFLVDDETRHRLASVGPRARKTVSDGHRTAGTKIPSYEGFTTGTLDQNSLREQYLAGLRARPVQTIDETAFKRLRNDDDDEGGDTDNDEEMEPVTTDNERKLFIRPNSFRSMSSQNDDFEDADFLKPRQ